VAVLGAGLAGACADIAAALLAKLASAFRALRGSAAFRAVGACLGLLAGLWARGVHAAGALVADGHAGVVKALRSLGQVGDAVAGAFGALAGLARGLGASAVAALQSAGASVSSACSHTASTVILPIWSIASKACALLGSGLQQLVTAIGIIGTKLSAFPASFVSSVLQAFLPIGSIAASLVQALQS